MTKHATLSASSSHKWLKCPPSALLEREFPDTTSNAAEEGTAAHAMAEHKLNFHLHQKSVYQPSIYDNDEMEGYTDDYVAFVIEQIKKAPLLEDYEIEEVLAVINDLTKWASEVQAYALDMAVNRGKEWTGYKLVAGRSVRKYTNDEQVAQTAIAHGYEDIYKKSLIGLTEMAKLMGKKQFDEILGELIIKPQGKPSLVPVSDKRKAMQVNNVKKEFNEIKEDI